jgi:Protein of unknown function (DUF4231)
MAAARPAAKRPTRSVESSSAARATIRNDPHLRNHFPIKLRSPIGPIHRWSEAKRPRAGQHPPTAPTRSPAPHPITAAPQPFTQEPRTRGEPGSQALVPVAEGDADRRRRSHSRGRGGGSICRCGRGAWSGGRRPRRASAGFQFQQNWLAYRGTAEALKHEQFLSLAAAGPYADAERADALLAERVEGSSLRRMLPGRTRSVRHQGAPEREEGTPERTKGVSACTVNS